MTELKQMARNQVFEPSPRFGDLGPVKEIHLGLFFDGSDPAVDKRTHPEMVINDSRTVTSLRQP